MNKRKMALMVAVLMIGILLVGSGGCSAQEAPDELGHLQKEMAQLKKDIGQLLQEKQEAAETERMAQIVANAVEERISAFTTELAEKELAQIEILIQLSFFQSVYAQSNWENFPPPWQSPSPYPGPTATFTAKVYRGDNFDEYVGLLQNPYPIEFNWGLGGPLGLTNYFSIRWEGTAWFEAGNYRFRGRADDGFKLYLDGQIILDRWSPQTVRTHEVTHYLPAGYHRIQLEYRERTGYAHISLFWERINS